MRIRYALLSCNADPRYVECWPLARRAWRRLGVEARLLLVRDGPEADGMDMDGVEVVAPLPDAPMTVQCTWGRFWMAARYPDEVVVCTDVDTLPLSRELFIERLAPLGDDRYVVIQPAGRRARTGRIRACYQAAHGAVMRRVLDIPDDWGEACRRVAPWGKDTEFYKSHPRIPGVWAADELFLTAQLDRLAASRERGLLEQIEFDPDAVVSKYDWLYDAGRLKAGAYAEAECMQPPGPYREFYDALFDARPPPAEYLRARRRALRLAAVCRRLQALPGGTVVGWALGRMTMAALRKFARHGKMLAPLCSPASPAFEDALRAWYYRRFSPGRKL